MINKRVISYSLRIVCLLIIGGFLYLTTFIQPKINFSPQISKVGDEDYKRIVSLHIKITTPFILINHVKIENPAPNGLLVQSYLQNNNDIMILGGGGYSGETELQEQVTISLKNASEDELINNLRNLKINVSWQNIWRNKESKNYYFSDYLN